MVVVVVVDAVEVAIATTRQSKIAKWIRAAKTAVDALPLASLLKSLASSPGPRRPRLLVRSAAAFESASATVAAAKLAVIGFLHPDVRRQSLSEDADEAAASPT